MAPQWQHGNPGGPDTTPLPLWAGDGKSGSQARHVAGPHGGGTHLGLPRWERQRRKCGGKKSGGCSRDTLAPLSSPPPSLFGSVSVSPVQSVGGAESCTAAEKGEEHLAGSTNCLVASVFPPANEDHGILVQAGAWAHCLQNGATKVVLLRAVQFHFFTWRVAHPPEAPAREDWLETERLPGSPCASPRQELRWAPFRD